MPMTKHDAIKCLSNAIAYAKVREETWADNIYIPALEIAVRAMAEERKKGKWIKKVLNYGDRGLKEIRYECSECEMDFDFKWNYCPYCGADMREEKTDE